MALCASALVPSLAHAQHSASEATMGSGYQYEFEDDPLHTIGASAQGQVIVSRGRASRVTLIRPRVQFVTEMLKSVEAL